MLNQEALDYIKQSRSAGINDQAIRQNLVNAGWPTSDVDSAVGNYTPTPALQNSVSYTPSAENKVPIGKILAVVFVFLIVLAGVGWLLISHVKKITPTLTNQLSSANVKPTDSRPQDITVFPMYGGYQKTAAEQKADTDFINTASEVPGGRTAAAAALVQTANQSLNQGDYNTAIKDFNQAWLLDWNNSDIYKGYIQVSGKQNTLLDLRQSTERTVAQYPQQATIQCFLGVIDTSFASNYQNTQKDLSSIEKAEFEKGLALDNNNPFCQLNYAASLYINGDYQEAWSHLVANSVLPNSRYDNQLTLNIYNKIQTLNSADEYSLIETTYQRLGQTDNAFAVLQKGVAQYPNNVPLMCDLGGVYINKWYAAEQSNPNVSNDLLKQAEMYLQKGIQLNPQSASCHGNYALAIYNDNSQNLNFVWPEVKKAESLGWVFDQKFLTNLQAASPEPKK